MEKTLRNLGFWSGLLSALFAVIWFVTFAAKDAIAPMPSWQEVEAYGQAFSRLRLLYVYPSLLLPITYIALLACIHRVADERHKVWSLIALAIGIVYATMASVNYNIQAVAVRQSLAVGQIAGIEMFLPDNTRGVFGALANSYVYLAFSMFAAGLVFKGGRLATWIRWLLLAQIVTAVGQVGNTMFDWSESIFIATSIVWVIGAPVAFVLLAVWFLKETRAEPQKGSV